jgi:hypothetical protein
VLEQRIRAKLLIYYGGLAKRAAKDITNAD